MGASRSIGSMMPSMAIVLLLIGPAGKALVMPRHNGMAMAMLGIAFKLSLAIVVNAIFYIAVFNLI